MALVWEFVNKGNDLKPEIVLRANHPVSNGDKILLFKALQGAYGKPVIQESCCDFDNGMANELVIGFDGGSDNGSSSPLASLNTPLGLTWINNNRRDVDLSVGKKSSTLSIKNLIFDVANFDDIKDLNPVLVVERYKPAKWKGTDINDENVFRPSGFKQSLHEDLPSEFPIERAYGVINIGQEKNFNFNPSEMYAIAKGVRHSRSLKIAWHWLQFRIKVTIDNQQILSQPLGKLKMIAQASNPDETNNFVISYKHS